jgi:hypothetical protein
MGPYERGIRPRYISAVETAKLVRVSLAREFPGVKFFVRTNQYSNGASIDVEWDDGPGEEMVRSITDVFAGADFDGMIDMQISTYAWLLPDGRAGFCYSPGTVGSRGSIPAAESDVPYGAEIVHFGANYVFAQRRHRF